MAGDAGVSRVLRLSSPKTCLGKKCHHHHRVSKRLTAPAWSSRSPFLADAAGGSPFAADCRNITIGRYGMHLARICTSPTLLLLKDCCCRRNVTFVNAMPSRLRCRLLFEACKILQCVHARLSLMTMSGFGFALA